MGRHHLDILDNFAHDNLQTIAFAPNFEALQDF